MGLGLGGVGEEAGGLDDDVHAQLAPGQLGGVAVSQHADGLAVDDDVLLVVGDLSVQTTHDGVKLEEVGESLDVGEVVDGDDLEVDSLLQSGAEEVAADAAEAVDTNAGGHFVSS